MRPMEKLFAGGPKRDSLRIIGTLVGVSPAAIAGARLTPEETAEVIAELAK